MSIVTFIRMLPTAFISFVALSGGISSSCILTKMVAGIESHGSHNAFL